MIPVAPMVGKHADKWVDSSGLGAGFFAGQKHRSGDYDDNVEAAWQRADLIRKEKGHPAHVCNVCGGIFHRNAKVNSTCGRTKCRYEWKKIKNRDRMDNGYVASRPTVRIPCVQCGRLFLPAKHTIVCCSPECQQVRRRCIKKAHDKGAKVCAVCGEDYFPYRPTQKCCGKPDCMKEIDRRSNLMRRREVRRGRRTARSYADPDCPNIVLTLDLGPVKVEGLPFEHSSCTPLG